MTLVSWGQLKGPRSQKHHIITLPYNPQVPAGGPGLVPSKRESKNSWLRLLSTQCVWPVVLEEITSRNFLLSVYPSGARVLCSVNWGNGGIHWFRAGLVSHGGVSWVVPQKGSARDQRSRLTTRLILLCWEQILVETNFFKIKFSERWEMHTHANRVQAGNRNRWTGLDVRQTTLWSQWEITPATWPHFWGGSREWGGCGEVESIHSIQGGSQLLPCRKVSPGLPDLTFQCQVEIKSFT